MARAKGLPGWRIMLDYDGPQRDPAEPTGFAMSLGFVVSGAILIEYVFDYPASATCCCRRYPVEVTPPQCRPCS